MKTQSSEFISAGSIAKSLVVSDAKVKKIISELGIQPSAKKGICNLYSKESIAKIKTALK